MLPRKGGRCRRGSSPAVRGDLLGRPGGVTDRAGGAFRPAPGFRRAPWRGVAGGVTVPAWPVFHGRRRGPPTGVPRSGMPCTTTRTPDRFRRHGGARPRRHTSRKPDIAPRIRAGTGPSGSPDAGPGEPGHFRLVCSDRRICPGSAARRGRHPTRKRPRASRRMVGLQSRHAPCSAGSGRPGVADRARLASWSARSAVVSGRRVGRAEPVAAPRARGSPGSGGRRCRRWPSAGRGRRAGRGTRPSRASRRGDQPSSAIAGSRGKQHVLDLGQRGDRSPSTAAPRRRAPPRPVRRAGACPGPSRTRVARRSGRPSRARAGCPGRTSCRGRCGWPAT